LLDEFSAHLAVIVEHTTSDCLFLLNDFVGVFC